jgi:hypothetical protein
MTRRRIEKDEKPPLGEDEGPSTGDEEVESLS